MKDSLDPAPTQSLGIPTWGVAVCSILSIAWVMSTEMSFLLHVISLRTGLESPLTAVLPHVVAFTAAVAGFRGLAALAAICAALPWGFYSFLTLALGAGAGTGAGLLFILQLLLVLFAIWDVVIGMTSEWSSVTPTRRMAGLASGALLCFLAKAALDRETNLTRPAPGGREAAARRDSLRLVEEHARQLASPAWKTRSSLEELHDLAHCIDVYHRATSPRRAFPQSFTELVRWATSGEQLSFQGECWRLMRDADTLRSPQLLDRHHIVRYEPPPALSDTLFAHGSLLEVQAHWDSTDAPVSATDPGARSYLLDRRGRVHVSAGDRRATLSDRVLPACRPNGASVRDGCWREWEF